MTHEARVARIRAAVEAHDPQRQDRERVPWRGGHESFPVIEIEVDTVLLNPHSHRIRAQLESHPAAETIQRDPWSDEAQDAIAEILRSIGENFEDLKTNLAEEGQQQRGVIARNGLLVNANRRTVALRDLGSRYISVAVLPEDATSDEIDELELRLQMQVDFREKYTFTNRLLFVDELITGQNLSGEDVARLLNLAASSDRRELAKGAAQVDQDIKVLAMIRSIQERGEGIPLTDFDAQEIALEELERRVREIREQDSVAAEQLFEIRLLGVLSNVPYRDLRQLDGRAVENQVLPIMDEDERLTEILPALEERRNGIEGGDDPAGLEVLEEEPATGDVHPQIAGLVDLVAESRRQDIVVVPTTQGERRTDRDTLVEAVHESLRAAASEIRTSNRAEDRLRAPVRRLHEADRKIRDAGQAYGVVSNEPAFDADAFEAALRRVHERLRAVADIAGVDVD